MSGRKSRELCYSNPLSATPQFAPGFAPRPPTLPVKCSHPHRRTSILIPSLITRHSGTPHSVYHLVRCSIAFSPPCVLPRRAFDGVRITREGICTPRHLQPSCASSKGNGWPARPIEQQAGQMTATSLTGFGTNPSAIALLPIFSS